MEADLMRPFAVLLDALLWDLDTPLPSWSRRAPKITWWASPITACSG